MPKIGLHALYMLNFVLFANSYSSEGKRLRKNWQNEEQTFIFNFTEDMLFFFSPIRKQTIFFSKKSPPLNIKWSVPYIFVKFCYNQTIFFAYSPSSVGPFLARKICLSNQSLLFTRQYFAKPSCLPNWVLLNFVLFIKVNF